ncbi:MAG: hypothetical protein GY952_19335 [Rhodobacteraceae bacterium]|nr:hypothetical protein [Paracoccaceae bacterium]
MVITFGKEFGNGPIISQSEVVGKRRVANNGVVEMKLPGRAGQLRGTGERG